MAGLKQPWLGIVATAAIIALAFLAIRPWSYDTFGGIVSDLTMCAIPFTALVGAFWKGQEPRAVACLRQPWRGLAYLGLASVVAVVVYNVLSLTLGGGKGATPFLAFGIILSVVVTFWLAITFGGWPFTLFRSRLLGGLALLVSAYVITGLVLRSFSFAFLASAPFYPGMDPGGPINAWDGLVTAVTCLATLFLFLHVDLWPLTRLPRVMAQPVLGVVWTVVVLVLGGGAYLLGTRVFGLTPDLFMVSIPVPFLFGSTVLLTMLQGSATSRLSGVGRGATSAVLAMVIGTVLARGYLLMQPLLTPDVPSDPLNQNLWLASALLAVTFPFLAMHHDLFHLWPLSRKLAAVEPEMVVEPAGA